LKYVGFAVTSSIYTISQALPIAFQSLCLVGLALQLRALDLHMPQIPDADSFAFTLPLRKLTKAGRG